MITHRFESPSPVVLPPAARFGRYEAVRPLGAGPDGTSVLAIDHSTGHTVELRWLRRMPEGSSRRIDLEETLRRYVLAPHAVCLALVELELDGDTPALVLEWAGDRSLSDRIAEGPLPLVDVLRLGERLAHGLGSLHRVGLVVGHLGPSSVVLDGDARPRIDGTSVRTRPLPDTRLDRACRAPESMIEAPDAGSDVYALGIVLATALLGHAPEGDELRELPIDPSLNGLLLLMTSVDRDARPSAAEVCLELRRAIETLAPELTPAELEDDSLVDTLPGSASGAPTAGTMLGRFRLIERIGAGGMGEVFRGLDMTTGDFVAVKILRRDLGDDANLLGRFRKEGRTLAEVRNPFVANLVEINADRGVHFLVLEFVEGPTLGEIVAAGAPLAERDALGIVADVCRALSEAHRRGIVHRDLKPDNLMFVSREAVVTKPADGQPRVKLCDFGIARQVDRSGTLALTNAGSLIGTPLYMAPEQCDSSRDIGPFTDVYALGATLFELLSGRPPFVGQEPMQVILQHLHDAAPALSSVAPNVSDATHALVARMLAKEPAERPADASELLDAIEGILRGAPQDITVHPRLPETRASDVVTYECSWDLESSPESLWPYVCNTDRLYRASGRAANKFERRGSLDGGIELLGSTSVAGVEQRWREYPYEWVEGRRWGALTVFEKGATHWMAFELELERRPGGGTRLRYLVRTVPRNFFFAWLVRFEIGVRQKKALGDVFRRIDALVRGRSKAPSGVDAFEEAAALSRRGETRLQNGLVAMREAGVSADTVESIGAFVRHAPPQSIARIRPLAFAHDHGLPEDAVIEAFLHGARRGIFTLLWDVLCPLCRIPSGIAPSLSEIESHAHCPGCNAGFELDFARSIEMVFRVSSEIRPSELRTYCVGGPSHSPHVASQVRLAPGERFVLSLSLEAGHHQLRSPQLPDTIALRVAPDAGSRRIDVSLGDGAELPRGALQLRTGEQTLVLTNVTAREIVARVERLAPREDAVTAARASQIALFREFFPDEVLAPGHLVSVASMTFVVTALADVAALAASLGDAGTSEILLRMFRAIDDEARRHGGSLHKVVGHSAILAFDRAEAAMVAALAIRARLAADERLARLALRIGVHRGPMIAATLGDRLDYFGQEVSIAMALPAYASPGSVILSGAVADEPAVIDALAERGAAFETVVVPQLGTSFWAMAI